MIGQARCGFPGCHCPLGLLQFSVGCKSPSIVRCVALCPCGSQYGPQVCVTFQVSWSWSCHDGLRRARPVAGVSSRSSSSSLCFRSHQVGLLSLFTLLWLMSKSLSGPSYSWSCSLGRRCWPGSVLSLCVLRGLVRQCGHPAVACLVVAGVMPWSCQADSSCCRSVVTLRFFLSVL